MNILKEENYIEGYCNEVGDLLRNKKVQEMKQYPHHGVISAHFHCVFVSYIMYKACIRMGEETHESTRASLLHDFYLYDWHVVKHNELHALYHPKAAAKNVETYIGHLSPKQRDMILHHMWPYHILNTPKSLDGFMLTIADKYCTEKELCGLYKQFVPIYNEILQRGEQE